MNKQEFSEDLMKKAEIININIREKNLEKFYQYMNLLIEWNQKMNLTAIIEPKEIIQKHFIDSITVNKYVQEAKKVLDVGTGAGFPGIPLKIINSNCEFTLVDSLNKRIHFLEEVCQQLNLEKIQCLHARAEELARNEKYREKYDIVTSRAVARLSTLLEYMLPFIKIRGQCICMKGANIVEELEEAKKAIKELGGELEQVENIYLPESDIERNIVVIKKIKCTPNLYPRKAGIPSKQPII